MEWLSDNKEWIFSGIGVFIIGGLVKWLFNRNTTKRYKMKQKSGDNSINIQIGGDYKNGQNETNCRG